MLIGAWMLLTRPLLLKAVKTRMSSVGFTGPIVSAVTADAAVWYVAMQVLILLRLTMGFSYLVLITRTNLSLALQRYYMFLYHQSARLFRCMCVLYVFVARNANILQNLSYQCCQHHDSGRSLETTTGQQERIFARSNT